MAVDEKTSLSVWSREQDKAFENALATHPEDLEDRWEKIAADVPGKILEEVKLHYDLLVQDVDQIESGCVPLPDYSSTLDDSSNPAVEDGPVKKGNPNGFGSESNQGKGSKADQERRKGIAWTEEEHRLFLLGLEKYGKGDWRSISRNFVATRTPTQVASHAQKYFIRLNSMNKDRRRSSIHDITSVNNGELSGPPQGPIVGQENAAVGTSSGQSNKQQPLPPMGSPGIGVYGTPIGQPTGGSLLSAVGTPVSMPGAPHMAYGVRAPVPGAMVTGASMPMGPMAYLMHHR